MIVSLGEASLVLRDCLSLCTLAEGCLESAACTGRVCVLCWRAGSVAGRDLADGVVRLGVRKFARESARVGKCL